MVVFLGSIYRPSVLKKLVNAEDSIDFASHKLQTEFLTVLSQFHRTLEIHYEIYKFWMLE